jgi:hypothetical protein
LWRVRADRLALSPEQVANLQRQKKTPAIPHVRGEFLRGPVPMAWLLSASRLPGKALAVGVWLWFRAGIEKSTTIDFSATKLAKESGIPRMSLHRGLKALESAGLIMIFLGGAGRKATVTLVVNQAEQAKGNTYGEHPGTPSTDSAAKGPG